MCIKHIVVYVLPVFLTVNLGFAEVSTPEEWIETGEKFMNKSLFKTAATCFREAGDFEMEKIAKCHQKALDASKYVNESTRSIK